MTTTVASFPELTRTDATVAMVTTWRVGDRDRQLTVAEAVAGAWRTRHWPSADLLSYSVFGSTRGDTLLHYSQWTTTDSAAVREQLRERWSEVNASVPGIERLGGHQYWRYRSTQRRPRTSTPGCYVTVRAEFSRPDARRWADGVFEASALDPRPVPGLIGAHFHLSLDGRHMLNLAEWSDEQAHRRQVDESGGPVRTATQLFPGLTRFSFERFELLHHLDG